MPQLIIAILVIYGIYWFIRYVVIPFIVNIVIPFLVSCASYYAIICGVLLGVGMVLGFVCSMMNFCKAFGNNISKCEEV